MLQCDIGTRKDVEVPEVGVIREVGVVILSEMGRKAVQALEFRDV